VWAKKSPRKARRRGAPRQRIPRQFEKLLQAAISVAAEFAASRVAGKAAASAADGGLKRAHYRNSRLPFAVSAAAPVLLRSSSSARGQAPFVLLTCSAPPSTLSGLTPPPAPAPSTARRSGHAVVHPGAERAALSGRRLAFATDRVIRARGLYRSIVLLPYAIAPVIAGTRPSCSMPMSGR
jgi:sn-glycerol 3-phosphate transport system permease protein